MEGRILKISLSVIPLPIGAIFNFKSLLSHITFFSYSIWRYWVAVFSSSVSVEALYSNLTGVLSQSHTCFSLSFRTIVNLNIFSASFRVSNSVLTGILSFLTSRLGSFWNFLVRVRRLSKIFPFVFRLFRSSSRPGLSLRPSFLSLQAVFFPQTDPFRFSDIPMFLFRLHSFSLTFKTLFWNKRFEKKGAGGLRRMQEVILKGANSFLLH